MNDPRCPYCRSVIETPTNTGEVSLHGTCQCGALVSYVRSLEREDARHEQETP